MMNGATIPRPCHAAEDDERTTMPASHAHAGTRRAPIDQARPRRGAARARPPRASRPDPDVRGGARDVAEHRVGDRLAAGRLLERGDVELGDAVEVVLAPDELERRRATSRRAPSSRASSSSAA